jgi:hypothetical protein
MQSYDIIQKPYYLSGSRAVSNHPHQTVVGLSMSLRNEYLREKAYIVGSSVGESYNPGHISRKNRKDISNVNLVKIYEKYLTTSFTTHSNSHFKDNRRS